MNSNRVVKPFRPYLRVVVAITTGLILCVKTADAKTSEELPKDGSYPRRPIKVVVPFGAGGGSDTFGRIIQSAIDEHSLLPEKLVMINVPGAGGTIGSRRVKNARPDGYTILLLHEGILTAKYSGRAAYGPEAFEPIAGTGSAVQLIAVAKESPLKDLRSLVKEITEKPDTVVFGANLGAPSHFAGLMIEQQKDGATFRFTQTGGGAKRIAGLQGGHMDVTSFSISEYIQYRESGIRALAVLGEERHPEVEGIATAREQGFDIVSVNSQFWWAPKGTPQERINVVAEALTKAMQTATVQKKLANLRIDPVILLGPELDADIQGRIQSMSKVAQRPTLALPNIPLIIFLMSAFTGIVYAVRRVPEAKSLTGFGADVGAVVIVIPLVITYVLLLQFTSLGFVATTIGFLVLVGVVVLKRLHSEKAASSQAAVSIATIAVSATVFAFGIQYLFTQVLIVDLP